MDSEKIFFGDLYKITKYDVEIDKESTYEDGRFIPGLGHIKKENTLYKRHAVLLKTFDNHYIDLEQLNWLLTLRINHKIPFTPKSALLTTIPLEENQIYVDSSSITPYLSAKTNVNLKIVRKWQKQAK